jgi:predicted dehydrogenase
MRLSRRGILKTGAALAAPTIVPSSVFGRNAPSNRVVIGAIGAGRISRSHDMKEIHKHGDAQIVAVCDVDTIRLGAGKELVDARYTASTGKPYAGTRMYTDYRELLANKEIDAVLISTPDHHHSPQAVHAVRAGKHVYLQKPAALTIAEGRTMADAVKASGRIGKLRHVEVGLPGDPSGPEAPPMPVPSNLNYDAWLGTTPEVPYTEIGVHPQDSFENRPGWLRIEQYGAGMITGWGSHHIDTAHWGMDMELSGPVEVWGKAEFPKSGLWDVHGAFETHARYGNGVTMTVSGALPNGVKFIGDRGWIFVTRSGAVTSSDPSGPQIDPLQASDPKILTSVIGPNEVHLLKVPEQHRNWLDAILTGVPVSAPAEVGHRACSTCLLHWTAMKTGRRLKWDPKAERFIGDDEANAMLSRPQRAKYAI